MNFARDIFLSILEFGGSQAGIVVLFGLLLAIRYFPALRNFPAAPSEECASVTDQNQLQPEFSIATSNSTIDADGPTYDRYNNWVRQQEWEAVHHRMLADDAARTCDETGQRFARIGVTAALREIHSAIGPGGPEAETRALKALEEFDARFGQNPQNLAAAILAAEAQIEIGLLYRGDGTIGAVSAKSLESMQHHFDVAIEILRPFKTTERGSPMLAATNFRLAVGLSGYEMLFSAARSI